MGTRRGRGEGNIRQRPDGRWEARIDTGWRDGSRVRRSIYGATRAEVAAQLRDWQDRLEQAEELPRPSTRLGSFLERWLEDVVRPNREFATWRGYEVNIRRHIVPQLGNVPIVKLTPAHVQRLLTDLQRRGLAPRTVQYVHATLRAALTTALRWDLVSRNVASLVTPATVRRPEVVPFDPDEAVSVLAAAEAHRLRCFFTVAMSLGLRPSEALALQWADLDLERRLLRVRRALEKRPDGYHFKETKSRSSRRTIVLPEVCIAALRKHRAEQAVERLSAGEAWVELDLVFCTHVGTPIHRSEVSRQFTLLLKQAGVEHRRLYDCRHTAATLLLAQGVSPRVVMETLGHSSYTLTMDTYAHVLPAALVEAAEAMDRALGGGGAADRNRPLSGFSGNFGGQFGGQTDENPSPG